MVASQSTLATSTAANSSENTVQGQREIEDDVSENEGKSNSPVNQIKVNIPKSNNKSILIALNLF